MNKDELIKILKILGFYLIALIVGFELGVMSKGFISVDVTNNFASGNYSFDIGNNLNSTMNNMLVNQLNNVAFCSVSNFEYGLKCNGTRFVNKTGMYCDGTMVCEN